MTSAVAPSIDIRRTGDRFKTEIDWLDSNHSFSFGHHYDVENTHFGLLLVSNDDIIAPESGFSTHPHNDMEIVTWILKGKIEHQDSEGNAGEIYPDLAQRMTAGTGIRHSEINNTLADPVRLVQMWVVPDEARVDPGYQQVEIGKAVAAGGLVPLASGRDGDAAISIRQQDATLWVGRLKASETVTVPTAPFVHLYVAEGAVDLEGAGPLGPGDAARISLHTGLSLSAGAAGAEVLIWEMHVAIG